MQKSGMVEIVDGVVQMGGDAVKVGASSYGGGMGVFALRNLSAGEIILVEEAPLIAAQKSMREALHMQLAKRVLHDSEREALLKQMAVIYPRSLQEVDPVTLARARKEYAKSVQRLLQEENSAPAGVRHLCEAELLALVLKIAFSSFMGGIYVAGAMFNHSCRPNVISQPRPNKAPGTCMMVTRAVKEGEELCFSYLSPLEQSYRQRQKKFDFQHLSELAPSPWPAEMEAFSPDIEHRLAAAAAAANCGGGAERQNDAAREGAEDEEEDEAGELTCEEAEAHLCHMQDVLDSVDESTAAKESDAKSLLKDVWDLKEEAEGLLHSRNIVLCRINNTAVRLAHQLLVERPHAQWAIAMLQCSQQVAQSWNSELLGPDHPDLARINMDKSVALTYLLEHAADALYATFPEEYGSWQKASKAELAAKNEALRIAALYEHTT